MMVNPKTPASVTLSVERCANLTFMLYAANALNITWCEVDVFVKGKKTYIQAFRKNLLDELCAQRGGIGRLLCCNHINSM